MDEPHSLKEESTKKWGQDQQRSFFSHPYNFAEALTWIVNRFFGPSSKYKEHTSYLPGSIVLNSISPVLRLGFLGDIMPVRGNKLQPGPGIRDFFSDTDYLVGNFEGVYLDRKARKVFMAQAHKADTFEVLSVLSSPEKIILSCANNHAGDFGPEPFAYSLLYLRERGFRIIGSRDEPNTLVDGKVNIAGCTAWANQPSPFISGLREIGSSYDTNALYNILFPHWGYEFQLYPYPKQIEKGQQLLPKWDMVVGHHTHCPQPVTACRINGINKLLAYSLGNFTFGYNIRQALYGIILKAELGPMENGKWAAGKINWGFTRINFHLQTIRMVTALPF